MPISLNIGLNIHTGSSGTAGWYVKLVNSGTGTHSEAFVSGQKTIYG